MQALTVSRSRPVRGGALDALRFLAAAFIVLYHFAPNAPADLGAAWPALERGWLATNFFLILSGYVLGRAYGARLDAGGQGAGDFLLRRLARVWPAHLMVLGGFVALVGLAALAGVGPLHPERFGTGELFSEAALIHAWGVTHQASWNEPSWTLSALVVCYAVFPWAWRATRAWNGRAAAALAALVVMLGAAALSLTLLGRSLYDLPFDLGVLRALPLFLVGLLLARLAGGWRPSRAMAVSLGLPALALLAVVQAAPAGEAQACVSVAAIAVVVFAADALRTGGSRLVAAGARLSFALFITHALAGAVWFGGLRAMAGLTGVDLAASWWAWAAAMPFALACAWLFDRLLDAPAQAWLRPWLARRGAPRGEVVAG